MENIDLDTAIVGHRKLRNLGEAADQLHQLVNELLTAEDYPGLDPTIEVARGLQDRIRWILGEPELEHRHARAGHLLDHGVRVVQQLLDATTHEAEDIDVARGWIKRVDDYRGQ